MKKKKTFVDIRNARHSNQIEVMKKIIKNGDDPFAMKNLDKYHNLPVLWESKYWLVTTNQFYKDSCIRFLIILKRYRENVTELSEKEFKDLLFVSKWAIRKYKVKGGGLCMRFGDTLYSGATVKHLHAHIIEPKLKSKNYQPVPFWIGGQKTKSR